MSTDPAHASDNPGIHRFTIGGVEAVVLSDGQRVYPLQASPIANASLEEVGAALAETDIPSGHMRVEFNALAIRTDNGWLLIDTGNGPTRFPTTGKLPARLAEAGIRPEDVTAIAISHFHPDHINGLLTRAEEPAFPKARIVGPQAEIDYWLTEKLGAEAEDPALAGHFANARRVFERIAMVRGFEEGDEIVPGVIAVSTPGHTPGHSSFEIRHGGSRLLVIGDAINQPVLYAAHPDWQPVADILKPEAVRTRRTILDACSSDGRIVIGYHFPFPGLGRLESSGEGYRFRPLTDGERSAC
ncbi:MAG: MBL fold metallo-hydrolase [Nitratireductor sp.]|nr:MBL fold metallo-hydrolase [Nitratireductor sp.]